MAVKVLTATSNLSTSSGWATVDPNNLVPAVNYNTVFANSGYPRPLSTTRYIPVTFTHDANQVGIFLYAYNLSSASVVIKLQHFNGSTWDDVTTDTITPALGYNAFAPYFFPLTSYSVTTGSGIWRYSLYSTQAGAFAELNTGDNLIYAVATDYDTLKISSGDELIISPNVTLTIDEDLTLGRIGSSVGFTTSAIICANGILKWENPPSSSHTLTLTGPVRFSAIGSQVLLGDEDNRIPASEKAIIDFTGALSNESLFQGVPGGSSLWFMGAPTTANCVFNFYGEEDNKIAARIAEDANSGQPVIVTTEDLSSDWAVGDHLTLIGKDTVSPDTIEYTISNISGTSITLNTNLDVKLLEAGAAINLDRRDECGIHILGPAASYFSLMAVNSIPNIILKGIYSVNNMFSGINTLFAAPTTPTEIKNVLIQRTNAFNNSIFTFPSASTVGMEIDGIYYYTTYDIGSSYGHFKFSLDSGYVKNVFVKCIRSYTGTPAISGNNNVISGIICGAGRNEAVLYGLSISGAKNTISDIMQIGNSGVLLGLYNSSISNFRFERSNTYGIRFSSNNIGLKFYSGKFCTNIGAGVSDFYFDSNYLDTVNAENCSFGSSPNEFIKNIENTIDGSYFRIQNFDNTQNDCRGYLTYGNQFSTGTGLIDTTCKTAGGYALRFQSTSSVNRLEWTFTIPTGNIQNKTMMVGVWCKINSATYYAGTHQKPRLTIDYDNGTVVYVEATATTGWQFLSLPFAPTTTYGQITVTVSTMTDATGSDAYVYFDDFKTLFPAESPLDTQSLDLWANGLPVTPPLATVLSANDVWAASAGIDYGTGTIGDKIKNLKNPSLLIDGEIIV